MGAGGGFWFGIRTNEKNTYITHTFFSHYSYAKSPGENRKEKEKAPPPHKKDNINRASTSQTE